MNPDDQLAAMDKPMDRVEHRRNAPRQLDDSERNQLAALRHDPCFAHCEGCGRCIEESDAFSVADGTHDYYCEDC